MHTHTLPVNMNDFNVEKYLGKWYEQGSTPLWFSRGCENTTAEYKLNDDGTLTVLNSCTKDGKPDTAKGKAFPTKEPTLLKVGFFPSSYPIFRADYQIVHIEEKDGQYKNAIVKSGKNAWILTRDKRISQEEYDRLNRIARRKGVIPLAIQRTKQ